MQTAVQVFVEATIHPYNPPAARTEGERLEGLKPHGAVRGLVVELERVQMQQQRIGAETCAFLDVLPTHQFNVGIFGVCIAPFAQATMIQSEHFHARAALVRDNLNRTVNVEGG